MKGFPGLQAKDKALAAWPAALRLQQFGYGEISREVSVSIKVATAIVRAWENDGKVRAISDVRRGPGRKIFEVIAEQETRPAPDLRDGVDHMWLGMRKFKVFSPLDLAAHAALPITPDEARAYCRLLLVGGYLKVKQTAVPNLREAIYRLVNETGVGAPRERRVRCIVDPNLGRTTPLAEVGV